MSKPVSIDQRLAELPRKTAEPFRQLLAAGQLSDDVLTILLDAAELAGDTTKLLGFAVGYLHLRSQGVPVHDVVRMARNQKRRVNLAWSPKRWQTEHDRLSRAEALHRLAADNVQYDLSRFSPHLPARFDGYLIRTSRRLGMEGLRQRHCVASYHARLQRGSCAIAAVFVNRRRWTVELTATEDPDRPLRIAQARTRLNGMPSSDVLETIHRILGIDPAPAAASFADQPGGCAYMANLRRVLPVLREHAVPNVVVHFDGSCDEGSIDGIDYDPYVPDAAAEIRRLPVTYEATVRRFEDGRWVQTAELTEGTLDDALEHLTYDYLEETGVDWYNNDGGFGELVIDVERGIVSLDVHARVNESFNAFSAEHDILTGEETR